jgi:hypothetical protein
MSRETSDSPLVPATQQAQAEIAAAQAEEIRGRRAIPALRVDWQQRASFPRSGPFAARRPTLRYVWQRARFRALALAALSGGVVAATIDLGAACVISQRGPRFIAQVIAGGLLARQAFAGGMRTVILGVLLQELMGVLIAAIFVSAAVLLPGVRRRWVAAGLLYGVVIFIVMNYLVLPLSAWRQAAHFTPLKLVANLAAMLLFGVIVARFARGAFPPAPRATATQPAAG